MTDRQLERDYINAKRFAESIGSDRLEEGVSVLRQLHYFSKQMRDFGLNPESSEHCELAKQSLEERLNATKNGLIVSNPEELIVPDQDKFKEFYFSECMRVKEELLELYTGIKQKNPVSFSREIFKKDNERHYTKIKCNTSLMIQEHDRDAKWNTEKCLHGFLDVKIKTSLWGKVKIYGRNCEHISKGKWNNFDYEANQAYLFYLENSRYIGEDLLPKFEYYFSLFRKIPDELRKICYGEKFLF